MTPGDPYSGNSRVEKKSLKEVSQKRVTTRHPSPEGRHQTDLPIKIRGFTHSEVPLFDDQGTVTNQEKAFIASSWSHQERANPVYFWVSRKAFHYQFYLGVVCFLLDVRPELFHVAHNTEKPDQILGWMCADFPLVYQSHVKDDFKSKEYGVQDLLTYHYTEASPWRFMELINDSRKNQVAENRVFNPHADTQQAGPVPAV